MYVLTSEFKVGLGVAGTAIFLRSAGRHSQNQQQEGQGDY